MLFHQSLSRWQKKLRETGDIESRGSGNYACSSEIGDYEEKSVNMIFYDKNGR